MLADSAALQLFTGQAKEGRKKERRVFHKFSSSSIWLFYRRYTQSAAHAAIGRRMSPPPLSLSPSVLQLLRNEHSSYRRSVGRATQADFAGGRTGAASTPKPGIKSKLTNWIGFAICPCISAQKRWLSGRQAVVGATA